MRKTERPTAAPEPSHPNHRVRHKRNLKYSPSNSRETGKGHLKDQGHTEEMIVSTLRGIADQLDGLHDD